MFKQVKKARELQDDVIYKNDEIDWFHWALFIFFILGIIVVSYSNLKVENQIKNKIPTKNIIVETFQDEDILDENINFYGNINEKK